jgi:hypothetical protein
MTAQSGTDTGAAPRPAGLWRRPATVLRKIADRVVRRRTAEPPRLTYEPIARVHERHILAPSLFEAPHELRRRIDELARAGALDEGNGHVFDATIRSWVEQWCDQIQDEYDDQQVELRLRQAEAEAECERRDYLAELAERQLNEADERLQRLRADVETDRRAPRRRPAT